MLRCSTIHCTGDISEVKPFFPRFCAKVLAAPNGEKFLRRLDSRHEDVRNASGPDATDICEAIERIGDHAANISVAYVVKGRDIRHVTLDRLKDEIWLADVLNDRSADMPTTLLHY